MARQSGFNFKLDGLTAIVFFILFFVTLLYDRAAENLSKMTILLIRRFAEKELPNADSTRRK